MKFKEFKRENYRAHLSSVGVSYILNSSEQVSLATLSLKLSAFL